jgi:hypothetical protein
MLLLPSRRRPMLVPVLLPLLRRLGGLCEFERGFEARRMRL